MWLSPDGISGTVTGNTKDYSLYVNGNFGVTTDGRLHATGADIKGAIYATSLKLDSTSTVEGLSYNDLDNTPDLTVYIQKDGTLGTVANGATGFKVSRAGLLQASNAVIYGTLYSSAGNIGGWEIRGNYLGKCDNPGTSAGVNNYFLSPSGIYNWWTGDSLYHNWFLYFKNKFGIDTDGNMWAKDGHFSGTVYANGSSTFTGNLSAASISSATINGYHIRGFSLNVVTGGYGTDNGIAFGPFFIGKKVCGPMRNSGGTYKIRDITSGDLVFNSPSDWNDWT